MRDEKAIISQRTWGSVHLIYFRQVLGYPAEAALDMCASYHAWAAVAQQATLRGLPYSFRDLLGVACS